MNLNLRLKSDGFKTFSEFVRAYINGKYPTHQRDEQVEKLLNRIRQKGITDPLTGEFNPTFYRNFDAEDSANQIRDILIDDNRNNDQLVCDLIDSEAESTSNVREILDC